MFHPDSGDYEFSDAQNSQLRRLSSIMVVFGLLSVAWSAAVIWRGYLLRKTLNEMATNPIYQNSQNLTDVAVGALQSFVGALIPLAIGALAITAARSFREIAETKGSDIPNLMDALRSLTRMYTFGFVLAMIMFVLLVGSIYAARYLLL